MSTFTLSIYAEGAGNLNISATIDVIGPLPGEHGYEAHLRVHSHGDFHNSQIAHWETGGHTSRTRAALDAVRWFMEQQDRIRAHPAFTLTPRCVAEWAGERAEARLYFWWAGGWVYKFEIWAPGEDSAHDESPRSFPGITGEIEQFLAGLEFTRWVEKLGGEESQIVWHDKNTEVNDDGSTTDHGPADGDRPGGSRGTEPAPSADPAGDVPG